MNDNMRDVYGQAAEDAKSYGVRRNFGLLTVEPPIFKKWQGEGIPPVEIDKSEYDTLANNQRFIEAGMSINIREFNSELDFDSRRVVKIPSKDWKNIVSKSLGKTLGKSGVLSDLNGRYVEAIDVPTGNFTKNNTELHMFEFVRVFEGRDDCWHAYQEVYGGRQENAQPATPPVAPAPVSGEAPAQVGQFPPDFGNDNAWVAVIKAMKAQEPKSEADWIQAGKIFNIDEAWSKVAMNRAPLV
jgi:hypothetical protein